jgi:hypothetical protein
MPGRDPPGSRQQNDVCFANKIRETRNENPAIPQQWHRSPGRHGIFHSNGGDLTEEILQVPRTRKDAINDTITETWK